MESTRVKIVLVASVSPSEDAEKVLAAARNVFGKCDCVEERAGDEIRLTSDDFECLRRIHDQLRDRRVRDAARRLLLAGREANRLRLMVNRQAASVGTIALCASGDESPLGPLELIIESESIDSLVDWLTSHGEVR